MNRATRFVMTLVSSLVVLIGAAQAEEVLYARYPALSPDGQTIAFTYQGDIWTVAATGGEATRLTVHQADDKRPHFSPDGTKLLFTSRRYDNHDVYVMPVGGGTPTRLTFNSYDDQGTGWFPGSDSVVYTSLRDRRTDIYKVAIDGGMPVKLTGYPYEYEYNGRISADGSKLVFNVGGGWSTWYRRDMRQGRAGSIFIADRTAEQFTSTRLTDHVGHDLWPVLNDAEGEIYFVSCHGEWAQVYKMAMAGGEPTVMTQFEGDGVQWLNSNPQGTRLVFEQGFKIWTLDPASGEPQLVPITVSGDEHDNLVTRREFSGNVDTYALSPDEKKIVAVIHGELFILPTEEPEEGKRITFTSAREKFPVWGEDSRTVYYSSDRHGNNDIFSIDATTGIETQLTDNLANEVKPAMSPDGKHLVFYRGLNQLIRYDLEDSSEEVWVEGAFLDMAIEPTREFDWSPDSKWLAFSMADSAHQLDIYVANLDGEVHNVSQYLGWNYRPRFSDDGKKLYFTSADRYSQTTFEIDLVHEPVEFFESTLDSLFLSDEEDDDKKKDDKDDDEDKDEVEEVKFDFHRIDQRRHKPFTLDAGATYPVLTPDGEKYLFVANVLGEPQVWSVNTEDDPDLEQLTKSKGDKELLIVSDDSESLFFLQGGKIKKLELGKNKVTALSFKAVMDIDRVATNQQKYDETWQALNAYFYDSTFHGADWDGVRTKYAPVVDHIRTEEEFRNLQLELMGELRASHLGYYPKTSSPDDGIVTGFAGFDIDQRKLERDGLFQVSRVYTSSPADLAGLKVGQYLQAINAAPLAKTVNWSQLMAGTIDHRVTLSVSDKPDGEAVELLIKPISRGRLRGLVYEDWVRERRRLVDSLSSGRLAYLHINAMNASSLDRFQVELAAIAEHKEALLVDVRNNGGGWISVHVLGMLAREPFLLRAFRGMDPVSETKYRSKAFERPMACLINGYSFSNAEIFAEGFRTLGLGKVIGSPTAGYVIGTGSYYLIDGTRIRRPSTAAYTVEMEDTDLAPRYPDILVWNLPDDLINGRDPQLVRAVEELLSELE